MNDYLFVRIPRTASTSICQALNVWPNHKTALMWKERLGDEWNQTFKFTIVRHPYDRFLSMCQYFWVDPDKFEDDRRFRPQMDYIHELDYIGRFEDLDNSWEHICKQIDRNVTKLNHLKESKTTVTLTPQQKKKVYNYYRNDFRLLNYS